MIRCGIMVDSLSPSQLTFYLVNYVNTIMSRSVHNHFIFFLNEITPFLINPLCPCLNSTEIVQFNDGIIVTTTLNDTLRAINAIHNSSIKFYVWDLEWIRRPLDYFTNYNIFNNPRVEIIARSHEHAKMIENYANLTKVRVVENCDMEKILCLHQN